MSGARAKAVREAVVNLRSEAPALSTIVGNSEDNPLAGVATQSLSALRQLAANVASQIAAYQRAQATAAAGVVPGGTSFADSGAFSDNTVGATPKYAQGAPRLDGYKNTMARLYLAITQTDYDRLKTELTALDSRLPLLWDKVARSPGNAAMGYIEFLLQSATHDFVEKLDIVETLADKYAAYAYGSAPPKFKYNIAMLNNKQDDQAANMYRLYWYVLRATQLANRKQEVYFQYDQMIVAGTMTEFSWTLQAVDESFAQGSFTLLVRKIIMLEDGPTANSKYDAKNSSPTGGGFVVTDANRVTLLRTVDSAGAGTGSTLQITAD